MSTNNCIRCDELEKLQHLNIDEQIKEQLILEDGNIVNRDVRNERLAICKKCPQYLDRTCLVCGCFVEFRASLKNKECPHLMWKKDANTNGSKL